MTAPDLAAGLPEHPAATLARTGPAALPLCVRMRPVPYGMRAALPLLLGTTAIFVPLGIWIMAATGGLDALLSFAAIPVIVWALFAAAMAVRARGPVLAADSHGVWLRPELNRTQAAWLPWHGIEAVYVRRYALLRTLCVKPRDPAYDAQFAVQVTGSGETKTAQRIVAVWRARALETSVWVPLSHAALGPDELLARLRELAAGRCPFLAEGAPLTAAS